jgi:hypothetical protein
MACLVLCGGEWGCGVFDDQTLLLIGGLFYKYRT